MSGRSAYVRKKKAEVNDVGPTPLAGATTSSADLLFGYVSDDELEAPGSLPQFSEPLNSPTHASWVPAPSGAGYVLNNAIVPTPAATVSGRTTHKKSRLRAFMDGNSEKIRHKLAATFSGGKSKEKAVEMSVLRSESNPFPSPMADDFSFELQRTLTRHKSFYERPDLMADESDNFYARYKIKRFGPDGACSFWQSMIKDPELWDETGDTIVYLSFDRLDARGPGPSFRLHSSELRKLNSPFFNACLDEGYKHNTYNDFENLPTTFSSATFVSRSSMASSASPRRPHSGALPTGGRNSLNTSTPHTSVAISSDHELQATYEIFIFCGSKLSPKEKISQHLTTRNVFGLLQGVNSMVGLKYSDILPGLLERLDNYLPPTVEIPNANVARIIDWLEKSNLDDVRADFGRAASFLKWSESEEICYVSGFREAFVHCVGMHDDQSELVLAKLGVNASTRRQIQYRADKLRIRVKEAARLLEDFDYSGMWIEEPEKDKKSVAVQKSPSQSKAAYERCREFFLKYYSSVYGVWPPMKERGAISWLNRQIVRRLQADFGALFDFLVDREVGWDCVEERSGRKWQILHNSKYMFQADSEDLPLTDMLVRFDNLNNFPHIPNPYPLVPPQAKLLPPDAGSKGRMDIDDERSLSNSRALLSYIEASNIDLVPSKVISNPLVDAFINFEKTDYATDLDPHEARRGRWAAIYGILQTLAAVSVDTPGLRHTEGVKYFLNASVYGLGQWMPQQLEDAVHHMSHCWTIQSTWQPPTEDTRSWQDPPGSFRAHSIRTQSVSGHRSNASKSSLERRNTVNPRPSTSQLKRHGLMGQTDGVHGGGMFGGFNNTGPRSSFAASDRSGGTMGRVQPPTMSGADVRESPSEYRVNHGEEILKQEILRSQAETFTFKGKSKTLALQSLNNLTPQSPNYVEASITQNSEEVFKSPKKVKAAPSQTFNIEKNQTESSASNGHNVAVHAPPAQNQIEDEDFSYVDEPHTLIRRNTVATSNPSRRPSNRFPVNVESDNVPPRRQLARPTLNDVVEDTVPIQEPESSDSQGYDGTSTNQADRGKSPVRYELEGHPALSNLDTSTSFDDSASTVAREIVGSLGIEDSAERSEALSTVRDVIESMEPNSSVQTPDYYDYSENSHSSVPTTPHKQAGELIDEDAVAEMSAAEYYPRRRVQRESFRKLAKVHNGIGRKMNEMHANMTRTTDYYKFSQRDQFNQANPELPDQT
ncbi:hypothetical protein L228DRAFT_279327 [Xylona heveae TC161]|uniref:DUF8004 domain-containing protein n=1 Tax=Xylona heveae (strain CBS 132557 / TC161) TaxID=1328760 RepID=A0A165JD71_XYLHT|nr:hypothetical protein L228DRAFT_279327 [Xylona heveae TC161]KZF26079.1 hypothetical protein L228DRAFT_279327 [Xylona heveae TC161]